MNSLLLSHTTGLPSVETLELMYVLPGTQEPSSALYVDAAVSHEPVADSLLLPLIALNPDVHKNSHRIVQEMQLGTFVMQESVLQPPQRTYNSMYDMLRASETDVQATEGALLNIKTMLSESVKPHSHVTQVVATIDDEGMIWQYGQNNYDIVRNAVRCDKSDTAAVESETLLSIGALVQNGDLCPGDTVLELSLVPKGKVAELRKRGYFVHSMSYIARTSTLQADGKSLHIQSHFIAGTDIEALEHEHAGVHSASDMEQRELRAYELRTDVDVVGAFFRRHVHNETIAIAPIDFLRRPVVLNAGKFPDGGSSVVKELDSIAEELQGKESVFYGVPGPKQDYVSFAENCFSGTAAVDRAARKILAQARTQACSLSRDEIPVLLRNLSKIYITDEVLAGRAELAVLGARAIPQALGAIEANNAGNLQLAATYRSAAIIAAQPGGCALPGMSSVGAYGVEDKYGSLIFECSNGHVNNRPYGELIPTCTTCGVSVKC